MSNDIITVAPSVITIDPEFENLLPKQTPEQDKELEAQILREGCNTPLVVWEVNDTHILVDGHRRFAICQKHNRQFTVRKQSFANREEAKFWAVMEQLTRRNLNSFLRIEHALRFKPMIAARAKANKQAGNALRQNSAQAVEMVKTRDEVAKLAGVSHHTVSRVEDILAKANQPGLEKTIARAIKKAINALRNDEATINGVYQEYFGKKDSQPKERNPKTVSQARKENVKSDGDAFTRRIEETMNAVDAMRSAVDAVKGAFQSLFQDAFQTDEAVLQTMLVSANEPCKSLLELIAELQGKIASIDTSTLDDCPKDSSDGGNVDSIDEDDASLEDDKGTPQATSVRPSSQSSDATLPTFPVEGEGYKAEGRLNEDSTGFEVLTGSTTRQIEKDSMSNQVRVLREELESSGVIKDSTFVRNHTFKSSTEAARVIYGTDVYGKTFWQGLKAFMGVGAK